MSASHPVVLLASLDTKGPEAGYLRSCIKRRGVECLLVDIGYGGPAKLQADIDAEEVALAAGEDPPVTVTAGDTEAISERVIRGTVRIVSDLIEQDRCGGLIAFGGTSNTTLAAAVMASFPFGLPKLILSSAAALPAYAAKFFSTCDITIRHSVVDISSLNEFTCRLLEQSAAAICAMAAVHPADRPAAARPRIAVSSFRFSEECSQAALGMLDELGYEGIPFPAHGVGEDAMEALVLKGLFAGVLDIVPAGLGERLLGGNRAAGPDRLEAAANAGIPQVIATAGFDMLSCGPMSRRDEDDPLWRRLAIHERRLSVPDRFRVEARTSAEEVAAIARCVAEKLNRANVSAAVVIPRPGWSSLSIPGGELHDPLADAAFAPALRAALTNDVEILEVDAPLNSETFARVMVEALHRLIQPRGNP